MNSSTPKRPSSPPIENLTPKEKEWYSRHILLQDLELAGVKKIRRGRIAVIGIGGLAAPLLTYLAGSGVGQIVLIDDDYVTTPNLARQFLFSEKDVGEAKAVIASQKISTLNPRIQTRAVVEKAGKNNFEKLTDECDLIVETVDSTPAKLLIHDLALKHGRPMLHGAALAWEGQFLTIFPGKTPCLRCFFPHLGKLGPPGETGTGAQLPWNEEGDRCATEGVLSPLCGIVGSYLATEVLRFFTQPHHLLHTGKMLRIDLVRNRFYYLYPQKKNCSCGYPNDPNESGK